VDTDCHQVIDASQPHSLFYAQRHTDSGLLYTLITNKLCG